MSNWNILGAGIFSLLASSALADPIDQSGPAKVALIENSSKAISKRIADATSPDHSLTFVPVTQPITDFTSPIPALPQYCPDGTVDQNTIKAMIETEAHRQGGDAKLALAIADQESGFGTKLNSPAGARGVMQLMPATAAQYGVTDICDPAQNIRGGIAFLKDLHSSFGGNIMLMVAAYNSGEGRVMKARGIPSITETVNYTALVTNAYYGFDNAIKGGKRTKLKVAANDPAAQQSGVTEFPVQNVSDRSPTPIDQPKTKTEGTRQQWIGGSVLYVQ